MVLKKCKYFIKEKGRVCKNYATLNGYCMAHFHKWREKKNE